MALTQVQPGMLASDSQYYAYEHIRNDTKAIFYVGKGKGYRAKNKNHRNIYWKRVVEKANGFEVNYLCQNVDEELAYFCEEERIDQLKQFGIELTNLTSGGEGAGSGENHHMWGKTHPQKGIKRPWLRKRYLGENNPRWGKKASEETRKQMSESRIGKSINRPLGSKSGMKGKAYPEEGKRKLSEAMKGNKFSLGIFHSDETKAKMSASQKVKAASFSIHPNTGRKASEETRAKMCEARSRRIYTEEDKKKISEAVTAWHKKRKEKSWL